ncbi:PKD domain-containing protein [Cellvibrio sp. ARAG 10.3]|uniref:PKD domain-containing protein n=1 Tax=Cellvibrio sp. ARAG 10.3 TaxID=3451358 RepID=UPI003F48526A
MSMTGSAFKLLTGLLFTAALVACGGGGGGGGSSSSAASNVAPVANAGADKTVDAGTTVELVAGGSDSDGRITGYQWTQLTGTRVSLTAIDLDAAHFSFVAPSTGAENSTTLEFRLQVTDNDGATATDTVVFTINRVNTAPEVNAGADQTVIGLSEVSLVGTASDDSGEVESYLWTQTAGEAVSLTNADSATASFIAPSTNEELTLEFALTATDVDGATTTDVVVIVVTPENAPIISFIFPPATGVYTKTSISAFGTSETKNGATVATVEVSAGGTSVMADVEEDGSWRADNIPVPAGASEFTVTATITDSEDLSQSASAILLRDGDSAGSGEVWNEPRAVAVVPNADYVYVLTGGAFVRDIMIVPVDITTGHRGQSITDFTNPELGSQPAVFQDMLFDAENDRLLLTSNPAEGTPQIVAVDVATGVRTTISSDEQGTGESFVNPVSLEWGKDRQLLVADNTAHRIIMVNPVSGDRTTIADAYTLDYGIDAPLFASWIESTDEIVMTPNILNNHYFLGIQDWQSTPLTYVLSMNTGNGNTGPAVKRMVQGTALDEANNRLLVLDGDDQLIAVDLDSGNRVLLMEEVTGFGSLSLQEKDLEYDAVNKLLYIADNNFYRGLYVVDPQSGSVVLLSN